jgi:3-hydroxyacyl-[acyl-carrier-protein] dehydratase
MRWLWIDRIIELDRAVRCVTVKNVSLAEDVLHDHFPADASRAALPVLPNTLVIEGMAQTAGILVGHARAFREKVVLAKIGKAVFHAAALPGYCLRFTADLQRIDDGGAAAGGIVERIDPAGVDGGTVLLAEIELMFSHIDHNRSGLAFPEHNFVFTGQLKDLLLQSGVQSA